jgi:hypothetical protein
LAGLAGAAFLVGGDAGGVAGAGFAFTMNGNIRRAFQFLSQNLSSQKCKYLSRRSETTRLIITIEERGSLDAIYQV